MNLTVTALFLLSAALALGALSAGCANASGTGASAPARSANAPARSASAPVEAAKERVEVAEALDIAPVWAAHPVGFALLTREGRQFVAFYDAERRLTVAARRLDEKKWQTVRLPVTTGWDSHNYITLAADDDGNLHLSADMHVVPLKYFRTARPLDIASFERIPNMVGRNEDRCTYPRFLRGPRGEFLFTYRDGASGNGDQIYNVYDARTKTWKRLLDKPLTDGEGERNAYFEGPVRGPDGYFHLAWVWRESPDAATNHDLSYARSKDMLHWETSAGRALTLPIKLGDCDIVDPVPVGGGIINGNTKIGFDNKGRVVIAYHKNDAKGYTQPYNARLEDGRWVIHPITDWPYHWDFGGGGSLVFEIGMSPVRAEPDGRLTQDYRHAKFGSGTWLLDPDTLAVKGQIRRAGYPPELSKPESTFPEMRVRWGGDAGSSGQPDLRYVLRWETLDSNRDRPREGTLPPPSPLRLYALKTVK